MKFILIAWILNISTGEPAGFDRIETYSTPEQCITALSEGRISRAADGKIRSYLCVREDALGEVTL